MRDEAMPENLEYKPQRQSKNELNIREQKLIGKYSSNL